MSTRRAPMTPPDLPGFSYQGVLGSGGYSDVFLYEQQMPRRPVAIKVLLAEALDVAGRRQFTDEANSMAAVSTHPYIVTIFHAEVGRGGNPYLVMEFYPRSNYSVRARTEQLSVAEVLRTGVQVASAVETAHRAGILHRDIKPANILTSEYGRPGLTDFGIAATAVDGVVAEAAGMSIPWSPPEVINGSGAGDHTADVYSLGATIHTLLAGRSPFEVPGGSNRSLDLVERIERRTPPTTGRGDVPGSLERLLRQSMSKDPSDRPRSAADLARSLQEIEVELQLAMTPLEVRDEGSAIRSRSIPEDDDGTRLKNPVVIHSQAPAVRDAPDLGDVEATEMRNGTVQRDHLGQGLISGIGSAPSGAHPLESSPPAPAAAAGPPAVLTLHGEPPQIESIGRGPESAAGDASSPPARRNRLVVASALALALVAALVGIGYVMGLGGTTTTTTTSSPPTSVVLPTERPPAPSDLRAEVLADGRVKVSWDASAGRDEDRYLVSGVGSSPNGQMVTEGGAASAVLPEGTSCARVVSVRGTSESEPAEICAAR